MQMNGFIQWSKAAAVLLVVFLYSGCGNSQQAPSQHAPEVGVIIAETQRIVLTTELPGRTVSYRIAEIRPQVNGLIRRRLFTEGADVKAGDVLYQIDPAPYKAALDNASAALGRAEANIPAIRLRLERYKDLLTEKAVSEQDHDDAAAALNQAEADVRYWKAAVETARINLAYTSITAPISGRIGRSSVTEGAIVTAYQPPALATIQQLDTIYVDVQQSTTELLRLQRRLEEGRINANGRNQNTVALIMEDGTAYPLEGTLQFRDVTVDPSTGSVPLRVVFPNPEGFLLPGMFVRAVVREGINEKGILIPQQAVSRDHRGNPYALIVEAGDQIQQRPLNLERAIGDQWLVNDGLDPGERVVVEGFQRIRPGVKVNAVPVTMKTDDGAPIAPHAN